MIAVEIGLVRVVRSEDHEDEEQIIGTKMVVGETMGDCLDSIAPDPGENAIWRIRLISKEVLHA